MWLCTKATEEILLHKVSNVNERNIETIRKFLDYFQAKFTEINNLFIRLIKLRTGWIYPIYKNNSKT